MKCIPRQAQYAMSWQRQLSPLFICWAVKYLFSVCNLSSSQISSHPPNAFSSQSLLLVLGPWLASCLLPWFHASIHTWPTKVSHPHKAHFTHSRSCQWSAWTIRSAASRRWAYLFFLLFSKNFPLMNAFVWRERSDWLRGHSKHPDHRNPLLVPLQPRPLKTSLS